MSGWNLDAVSDVLQARAIAAIEAGDVSGFLHLADSHRNLELIFNNLVKLWERGLYERALVSAFAASSFNNHQWFGTLRVMFEMADRKRLREAGDPLPGDGTGPFTLYRGIAGLGRARRVRGWSWTSSIDVAKHFALRFDMSKPAVYQTTVEAADVLFYTNDRTEQEFVIEPPRTRPKQIWAGDMNSAEVHELRENRAL